MTTKTKEDKYWIRGGVKCKTIYGGPVMTVMRLLQVKQKHKDGTETYKVNGVLCRWTDEWGEEQIKKFHTKQLVPA